MPDRTRTSNGPGRARHAPPAGSRARRLFTAPPAHATRLAGWALLPLRLYLGFTFCFAGLQKLANPDFFNANNPAGIEAQLIAADRFSPLHPLLGHLVGVSTPIGVVIALGEVAVGLGTFFGLFTRLAAAGGALISLSLFLTVTWQVSPYYTGADLAYLMAWIPLIVAGSGGVWSLDGLIEARARREAGEPPPETVPIDFATVQQVCGQYDDGYCKARGGEPCQSKGCPFLLARLGTDLPREGVIERRALVLGGATAAGVAVVGAVAAGSAAGIGRALNTSKGLTPGETAISTPAHRSGSGGGGSSGSGSGSGSGGGSGGGKVIGEAAQVPVGGAASFTDPSSGIPGIVVQLTKDHFVAYDAVCPHAGCTVGYSSAAQILVCPCHGSEFNPADGGLIQGPATRGLSSIPIKETGGQLVVES